MSISAEPRKVMVCGDWHGNTTWARTVISTASAYECDTILQCGDFGFWTDNPETRKYLRTIQKDLEVTGITLFWVDGNHEDHDRISRGWRGAPPTVPAITAGHDRIFYLPRGYRWNWWGKTWMAVGGAVSVDKQWRREGKSWWPGEELTDSEVEYCCRPGQVDVIIAHDCPRGVNIPGIGPDTKSGTRGNWPPHVLIEAERHRTKLRTIWNVTGATRLYHGHYHVPHETYFGQGRIFGLDRDGAQPVSDHYALISADDFGPP